jgi:RNA-directed DNA polymerase
MGASSDPTAVKLANKVERSAAELVERRAGAKGNADQQSTSRTLIRRHINRGAPHVDLPQYTS